jgi:hypothetical protein
VATQPLVGWEVEIGMKAARILQQDTILKPTALFWFFNTDADEWRFIVATDSVRTRGQKSTYLRIRTILKRAGLLMRLPLQRVVAIDPSNPMLAAMRGCIATPKDEIASTEISNCVFNGFHVDGMHLYYFPPEMMKVAGTRRIRR